MRRSWMNIRLMAVLLTMGTFGSLAIGQVDDPRMWADGYVVVLGSGQNPKAVEKSAKRIARKSHIPYDYTERCRPGDLDYIGRVARDGKTNAKGEVKPFVSEEESSVYGLKRRLVIVGAVTYTLVDARRELRRYRSAVPDAYIKKFRQYMGCRS